MNRRERAIGPIGTAGRVLAAIPLIYIALVDGPPFADGFGWALTWYDVVLGLLVLPGIMVGLGLAARRFASGQVQFTGPLGVALNLAVIVALASNGYTGGGAALFYGTVLLIAAWRGQAGCESTAVSNWILGRDDQIGCPTFTPIDAIEARVARRRKDSRAPTAAATRLYSLAPLALIGGCTAAWLTDILT
jgi:hypothetical protein